MQMSDEAIVALIVIGIGLVGVLVRLSWQSSRILALVKRELQLHGHEIGGLKRRVSALERPRPLAVSPYGATPHPPPSGSS